MMMGLLIKSMFELVNGSRRPGEGEWDASELGEGAPREEEGQGAKLSEHGSERSSESEREVDAHLEDATARELLAVGGDRGRVLGRDEAKRESESARGETAREMVR